jgi:hypothetical protein
MRPERAIVRHPSPAGAPHGARPLLAPSSDLRSLLLTGAPCAPSSDVAIRTNPSLMIRHRMTLALVPPHAPHTEARPRAAHLPATPAEGR